MKQETTTIEKLVKFVNQRPGLDFCNYGDIKSYRSESREITRDKHDFQELISLAWSRLGSEFEAKLQVYLSKESGRLTINKDGNLEYCTGQYFPTEYRPAANRILSTLIWNDYRDEKDANGDPIYKSGHEIRKAISRRLSRRVNKNYFN